MTEIRDLRRAEIPEAIEVLTRGMRDNPLHVAAYGSSPERRARCHRALMSALLHVVDTQQPICAVRAGRIIGVCGVAPAGTCQPTAAQRVRMLPRLVRLGPGPTRRVLDWFGQWSRHDPSEPHVHLGPVAVDAELQGQGIGSLLLEEHCRRLDAADEVGYLETDKELNVRFYRRFGYETVDTAPVLGVPNWFMRRPGQ